MVNKETKKIKQELGMLSCKPKDKKETEFVKHYLGTKKQCLLVKTGELLKIAKGLAKNQNDFSSSEMIDC